MGPQEPTAPDHEGLQGVTPDHEGLQVFPGHSDKEVVLLHGTELDSKRRICGLSRKVFYVAVIVIALVVIVAAIGGGVGGALDLGALFCENLQNLGADS
jgi:hypothetical protein